MGRFLRARSWVNGRLIAPSPFGSVQCLVGMGKQRFQGGIARLAEFGDPQAERHRKVTFPCGDRLGSYFFAQALGDMLPLRAITAW